MEIGGRHVWITGASSGIGAALAVACAREGARLLLSARREERLREVAAACRAAGAPEAAVAPLDLAETDRLAEAAAEAETAHGPVDILVLNAGIGQRGLAAETRIDVAERILRVNTLGPIALTRAVLPGMLERGGGLLVVTSSVMGRFAAPTRSAYAASKHALHGYFEAVRAEAYDGGVRVVLVCPGWVRTGIGLHALEADGTAHGRTDPGQARGLAPERCAARMVRAMRREEAEVFVGGWAERAGLLAARFCPPLLRYAMRRIDPNG